MKKLIMLVLSVVLFMSLSACKPDDDIDEIVYVTVYPMQYLVEEIAGDTVLVKRVPGSTVHSESIDWSAKEIIDMSNADLLFYVNAGVDTYIPDNIDSTFNDGSVEFIDISQNISYNTVCYSSDHSFLEHDMEPITDCDDHSLAQDPHFWLDPVRMLQVAMLVKDKLIVTYPENAVLYENNFTVLSAALEKLDDMYQEMADEAVKPIITTVMLFSYLYVRYDIEIMSIVSDAHSSESVPSEIIAFKDKAIFYGIHEIIFEKNTNSPAGDQVLLELSKEDELASKLYMHGLGNRTEKEEEIDATYISIMYDNLDTLKEATK